MDHSPTKPLLLITGGGSGGHTMPAMAVANHVLTNDLGRIVYVGGSNGIEQATATGAGLDFHSVRTGKLRRASTWYGHFQRQNILDVFNVMAGFGDSIKLLRRLRPDFVLGTGGYVSVPIVAAASLLKIPTTIHEQTVVMGLANKITARMADRIALSSELSLSGLNDGGRAKATVTGNPIRTPILQGDADRCRIRVGANPQLPTVLILGGALGAESINRAVHDAMGSLLDQCNIVHQAGTADALTTTASTLATRHDELGVTAGNYFVTEFLDAQQMGDAYALATMAVGRSGAGTANELTATGVPSVLVPLVPTGGDEQRKIAAHLEQAGAAVVLPNDELTAESLLAAVESILSDPARRATMQAGARALYSGPATAALVELVMQP